MTDPASLFTTLTVWCQWPGMALGLAGAVLVAGTTSRGRRWGFALWIISNLCWIINGIGSQTWGLVIMQVAFLGTSGLGWWNNRRRSSREVFTAGM